MRAARCWAKEWGMPSGIAGGCAAEWMGRIMRAAVARRAAWSRAGVVNGNWLTGKMRRLRLCFGL
jgi:hypothetical protein